MRKINIIIPTRDNLENLQKTVDSIIDSTNHPDYSILIIVDNSESWSKINNHFINYENVGIIINSIPKGSIQAMNYGIKQTEESDILLTHDDMIFNKQNKDWLIEFQKITEENEKVGMVTYKGAMGISGIDYIEGLYWVGTWCMFIPRKTIHKIGILDDSMKIGEDIDYSYRLRIANLITAVTDFNFEHTQKRETPHSDQSEEIKREAANYFKRKWNLK